MILAHAFGQRDDLPIPLLLFVLGGAAVVALSFLLVLPTRVDRQEAAPAADGSYERSPAPAWGVLSLVVLALLIACGLAGSQEVAENRVPTAVWLVLWIAVPLSCGLVGDW